MATCDPQQSVSADPCLSALTLFELEVVLTQLACNLKNALESGGTVTCDIQQLLTDAKCFRTLTVFQLKQVQTQLFCDISNAIGGGGGGGGGGGFIPRTGANVALATVPYAANVAINLDQPAQQVINASGDITLSTSNRSDGTKGKFATAIIIPSPGPINMTLAAGIKKPDSFQSTIGLGKVAYITFNSTGPLESDTIAVQQIFS